MADRDVEGTSADGIDDPNEDVDDSGEELDGFSTDDDTSDDDDDLFGDDDAVTGGDDDDVDAADDDDDVIVVSAVDLLEADVEVDDDEDDDAEDDEADEDDDELEDELDELLEEDEEVQALDDGEGGRKGSKAKRKPELISEDEFTCRSCFLVKKPSQLADAEQMICYDCV